MSKVLVVYWSGTGNTEIMAEKIAEGLENAGVEVDLRSVLDVDPSEVADFDKIAFGCPSMADEKLEEDEFAPFFDDVEDSLAGKKVLLFGSYGWGNGEWMEDWVERTEDAGAEVFNGEGLILNYTPDAEGEALCVEWGEEFAEF
ncbi:MAG: flavodoxin [Acholeplasmataceae bacterium]